MKSKWILGNLLFSIYTWLWRLPYSPLKPLATSFLNSCGCSVRVLVTNGYHNLTGILEYRESQ